MGQAETQLVSTLQALLNAMKTIAADIPRTWWEVWGPSLASGLITVAGWLVLVLLNKRNNRDLLDQQKKEAAKAAILDAADDYKEYLEDVENPFVYFLKTEALSTVRARTPGTPAAKPVSIIRLDAVQAGLNSLTIYDPRQWRLQRLLSRDFWVFESRSEAVVPKILGLVQTHAVILEAFRKYKDEVWSVIDSGDQSAALHFLTEDRDSESVKTIQGQHKALQFIYDELSPPHVAKSARRAREGPASD